MQVIAFAGGKQSGKSSSCNYLLGQTLKDKERIKTLKMADDGNIIVNTIMEDGTESEGILDINRKDLEFCEYAAEHIWPHAKIYAIADKLKELVCELFDVDIKLVYGSNEDKNTLTKIKKEFFYKILDKETVKQLKASENEFLTIRELLMYFGSDICREMFNDCWINACLKQIAFEQTELALICDVRFPNEVEKIQAIGGKVIHLLRDEFQSNHVSERLLREMKEELFDGTVDNTSLDINQKNEKIVEVLNTIFEKKD